MRSLIDCLRELRVLFEKNVQPDISGLIEQRGLLFQPPLFHEFGHLFYRCHKRELGMFIF